MTVVTQLVYYDRSCDPKLCPPSVTCPQVPRQAVRVLPEQVPRVHQEQVGPAAPACAGDGDVDGDVDGDGAGDGDGDGAGGGGEGGGGGGGGGVWWLDMLWLT